MCVMFVQHFEPLGRRFTNFHIKSLLSKRSCIEMGSDASRFVVSVPAEVGGGGGGGKVTNHISMGFLLAAFPWLTIRLAYVPYSC